MTSIKYTILSCFFSLTSSEPLVDELVKSDPLFAILHSLKAAVALSFSFFKGIFSFVFRFASILLSPFLWVLRFSWNNLVLRPLDLFLYINRILYPITMFCLAAVFCGLFIGGCAGFAAEAVSSIMITATWGPQKRQTKSKMDFVEEELLGRISTSSSNCSKVESVEEDLLDRISTSSLGNRLFGDSTDEQSSSMPSIRKESVTTARASSSPVLIRRMRLSSTPNIRKSSWDWEAGDDQTGKKTL